MPQLKQTNNSKTLGLVPVNKASKGKVPNLMTTSAAVFAPRPNNSYGKFLPSGNSTSKSSATTVTQVAIFRCLLCAHSFRFHSSLEKSVLACPRVECKSRGELRRGRQSQSV